MTDPTPSERQAASESLGTLVKEVTQDLSTLMRQELELAKAELRQSATKSAKSAGMFGGAGYAASMTVLFLSIALWWALGTLIGGGWSGLIVAAIWAVIGLILFLVGRKELTQIKGVPQTVDSVKQIPDALKRNEENR